MDKLVACTGQDQCTTGISPTTLQRASDDASNIDEELECGSALFFSVQGNAHSGSALCRLPSIDHDLAALHYDADVLDIRQYGDVF
jgi:hypothetical protein